MSMMNLIRSLDDLLAIKPKGHFRISSIGGQTYLIVHRPGEEPQSYRCASPGIANQARPFQTDQGMAGYVEDAQ